MTAASASENSDRIYCSFCTSIIYENHYVQWLLLVLLEIFRASLLGSDGSVLLDSLDGNSALFANIV